METNDKGHLNKYIETSEDLSRITRDRGDIFKEIMFSGEEIENLQLNMPDKYEIVMEWLRSCVGIYQPVITFVVENPTDEPLILSKIKYEVLDVGQVMGGETGPLFPMHTYNHKINHEKGEQIRKLTPVFRVAANDSVSFNIRLISTKLDDGLAWLLKIHLIDTKGNAAVTETFQIIMSK